MNKPNILVFKLPELFKILNELKEYIEFEFYSFSNKDDLLDFKKKTENYLILLDSKNEIKNEKFQLVLEKFPNPIVSIIEKIKLFGIDDIHLRISSPPVISPCFYGIDIPTKEELLAHNNTEDEITKILGITSLRYLDYSEMSKMFKSNICGCCFNGKYNHELLEF